jgi:hypothetical protein
MAGASPKHRLSPETRGRNPSSGSWSTIVGEDVECREILQRQSVVMYQNSPMFSSRGA